MELKDTASNLKPPGFFVEVVACETPFFFRIFWREKNTISKENRLFYKRGNTTDGALHLYFMMEENPEAHVDMETLLSRGQLGLCLLLGVFVEAKSVT